MTKTLSATITFLTGIVLSGCSTGPDQETSDNRDADTSQTTVITTAFIPAKDSTFTMRDVTDSVVVTFSYDYHIGTTEVTQKQYREILSSNYINYSVPEVTNTVGDNFPVYGINWYDAVLFCNSLSKTEGKDTVYSYDSLVGTIGQNITLANVSADYTMNGYRLPTEAEWEYACRAGTSTAFFWGENWDDSYGWYQSNSNDSPQEVAMKLPNSFGLYDMSGNVWEWCEDWYGDYSENMVLDPVGPSSGTYRIGRGGGWNSNIGLKSGKRSYNDPADIGYSFGFRVVYKD